MPKVSIIIPVYNVEKYLRQALDSVTNQTLKDIEIICIDDCSTDGSLDILKEYAQKDDRIKLLEHEKNEGIGATRNLGLDNATGEYIMFLDSDDWYELNACEIAYNTIRERGSDILIFGDYIESQNKKIEPSWRVIYMQSCQANEQEFDLFKLLSFVWNKIYKHSFLKEYNIKMPIELKQFEDGVFNYLCEFETDKYSYIDTPLMTYRQLRDGATTTNTNGILYDLDALKYLYSMPIFQKQTIKKQLKIVERFLDFQDWNARKWDIPHLRMQIKNDVRTFLKFVESKYGVKNLKKISSYKSLKNKYMPGLMHSIFSIRNESKSHKVLTFMGIRIRLRRKKYA